MKKLLFILLMLFVSALCLATNEIKLTADTGQTLYVRIVKASDETIWDANSLTLAYVAAPIWANSAIALTENTNILGWYHCSMPTSPMGLYSVLAYIRGGATPANTDTRLPSSYDLNWSGTVEITLASLYADIAAVQNKIISGTYGLEALKTLIDMITTYTLPIYDIYGNKK